MIGELTNHLWQSTLFAVVAGLLTIAFRRNRAQVRYWLWLSASLKFFVPFSLLISLGSHLEWAPAAKKIATPVVSITMERIAQPFPGAGSFVPARPNTVDWVLIALGAVWVCGFAAIALIRLRGWRSIRAAVRSSVPIEIPAFKTPARVEVRSCPGLLEPGVVGLWRPILLLPAGILERLTPAQLGAVLTHELCHVRRRDNLFASIHMIAEATFWFHPLVWWIGARLVEERERACDEEVLSLVSEPHLYAEGILNVCKLYAESPLACVSGVTGADLKRRIEAIMTNRIGQRLNRANKFLLASAGAAALAGPLIVGIGSAPAVRAQSPAVSSPQFEVASIKPDKSGAGPVGMRIQPGGLFTAWNVTLEVLLQNAYSMQSFRIFGAPAWAREDRFDVNAKAAGTISREQMAFMFQTLLADRFKLTLHREVRQLPVYELVAARIGRKLGAEIHEGEIDCKDAPFVPGQPMPVLCAPDFGPPGRVQARAISMSMLATNLGNRLDRVVLDRTGLNGVFAVDLKWMPDPSEFENSPLGPPPLRPPRADGAPKPANDVPSLSTALEEQLGLKLESTRGPVDVIVIDRVEHPTQN
jgi:bla regulator protein blaR1